MAEALVARCSNLWEAINFFDAVVFVESAQEGCMPGWNLEWPGADPYTIAPGYLNGVVN